MSQPRTNCRKCGETLHYEGIGGMRLYRVENGRRIYRARCPGCKRQTDERPVSLVIERRKGINVAPKGCDICAQPFPRTNTKTWCDTCRGAYDRFLQTAKNDGSVLSSMLWAAARARKAVALPPELAAARKVARAARDVMRDPIDTQNWDVLERTLLALRACEVETHKKRNKAT